MNNSKNTRKYISNKALFVLDEEFYPDEWQDDVLMSEMMYTFRPKQINPERYNLKMIFWKEMIEQYCVHKGSSSFTIQELKDVFKRKGTSPYCLSDVVNQMIVESNVQDKVSFMSSSSKSWTEWGVELLAVPFSWTFNTFREKVMGKSNATDTVFISKIALKNQAKILQSHVRNAHSYNNIISMDDLMKSSEDIGGISRDGILLALQYLSSVEKSVYIEGNQQESTHHKLLIKFSEPHQTVVPISELERAVYNLETTEKFLIAAIDKKEQQLNEVITHVKVCLKDGKKQMAKTHLRKKHFIENDITKTMSILENIEAMLQRVHNSKSDKEILQTYKFGAEGIKTIFTDSGISIDNVYDVIEEMQDVLRDQDELQSIISTPLRGNQEINDAELEAELKSIIDDDKGNGGDNKGRTEEPKSEFNLMDLEMRLKRLRGDLPDLDEPILSVKNFRSPTQIPH